MEVPLTIPPRFASLPVRRVLGIDFPVAEGPVARTLGLALIGRERAGPGLLIPRCRSVHTFGMFFSVDLFLLDREGWCRSVRLGVPPGRIVSDFRARSVLETPAGLIGERPAGASVLEGGEKERPGP